MQTHVAQQRELRVGRGWISSRVRRAVGQAHGEGACDIGCAADGQRVAQIGSRAPIRLRSELYVDEELVGPVIIQIRRPYHPAHVVVFWVVHAVYAVEKVVARRVGGDGRGPLAARGPRDVIVAHQHHPIVDAHRVTQEHDTVESIVKHSEFKRGRGTNEGNLY